MIFVLLAGISAALTAYAFTRDTPLDWQFAPSPDLPLTGKSKHKQLLDYTPTKGQAHSPAIELTKDGFRVLWFEGSKEAQADVDIHAVAFTKKDQGWQVTDPTPYVTRADLSAISTPRQAVVTLGNTIQAGKDRLFATVASVGGWAMASVADVQMQEGKPTKMQRLDLSPMIGRSHLVKSPMVAYADGSHGLPAYFEMGAMYGTLVRFQDGLVRDQRRIWGRGKPIQPMIVLLSDTQAIAYLRDFNTADGYLYESRTQDGGQSWSEATQLKMKNPSAPVAVLHLGDGQLLMAANDNAEDFDVLRLLTSDDNGQTWTPKRTFTDPGGGLRYPMLRALPSGQIVLCYSKAAKQGIAVHLFNRDWVA